MYQFHQFCKFSQTIVQNKATDKFHVRMNMIFCLIVKLISNQTVRRWYNLVSLNMCRTANNVQMRREIVGTARVPYFLGNTSCHTGLDPGSCLTNCRLDSMQYHASRKVIYPNYCVSHFVLLQQHAINYLVWYINKHASIVWCINRVSIAVIYQNILTSCVYNYGYNSVYK